MTPITTSETNSAMTLAERIQLAPTIFRSAVIGTVVGALPDWVNACRDIGLHRRQTPPLM